MENSVNNDCLLVRFWVPNDDLLETGEMVYQNYRVAPDAISPLYVLNGDGQVLTISLHAAKLRYVISDSNAVPLLGSSIKDVEQKNIYQGDIVQIHGTPTLIEVALIVGMFALVVEQDGSRAYFPLMNVAGPPGVLVVGNIYENPEIPVLFRDGCAVV